MPMKPIAAVHSDASPATDEFLAGHCPHCGGAPMVAATELGTIITCCYCNREFVARDPAIPLPPLPPIPGSAPPAPPAGAAQPRPAMPIPPAAVPGVYPWDPDPQLLARVAAHVQAGRVQAWRCRVGMWRRTVAKVELLRRTKIKGQLQVYPDCFAVEGRLGCLGQFFGPLPWFNPIALLFAIPGIVLDLLLMPFTLMLANALAGIVRRAPDSTLAILVLAEKLPLVPRYWQCGDAVQVVRVDSGGWLGKRFYILVVAHRPLPGSGAGMLLGLTGLFRLFAPQRRLYAIRIEGTAADADDAAGRLAAILGLRLARAKAGFFGIKHVNG